jgi:hypothetical protein
MHFRLDIIGEIKVLLFPSFNRKEVQVNARSGTTSGTAEIHHLL